MNWINGHKTQIGAVATLTVGFLITQGVITETVGTYALSLLGVLLGGAIIHHESKKK